MLREFRIRNVQRGMDSEDQEGMDHSSSLVCTIFTMPFL